MSYKTKKLKENIKAHLIQTPKFKTNLISIFLTLSSETKIFLPS